MQAKNFLSILFLFSLTNNSYGIQHYQIEPFCPERDLDAVKEILNESSQYLKYETIGHKEGYTLQFLENKNYDTDVIRIFNQTIGFVNYAIDYNELAYLNLGKKSLIHLIGILDRFQRNGYGSALLKHVIKRFKEKNISTIILSVKQDNLPARALYEKEGFKIFNVEYNKDAFLLYKLELADNNSDYTCKLQNYPFFLAFGVNIFIIIVMFYNN